MKIQLEEYNPAWTNMYDEIRFRLNRILSFIQPRIEHIGSTSVVGLTSKPIIDILVGINDENLLDQVIQPLINDDYIYYQKYNAVMPYRRFFVKLKTKTNNIISPAVFFEKDEVPNELNECKLAHIHVLTYRSYHWTRHLAFREYLRQHDDIKAEYQKLKIELSNLEWKDTNEYNAEKNDFIKRTEASAIQWYHAQQRLTGKEI